MSFTNTIPFSDNRIDRRRHILRRRFGAAILGTALLGTALLGTAACGGDTAIDAGATSAPLVTSPPSTSTPMPSTTTAPATTAPATTASTTTAPTTTPVETTMPRPTATRDEVVDIDGVQLHVRCAGSGDSTVLLIAGFEEGDEKWGHIEPDLAARARVCSYARAGTGTSDPAGPTQTFTAQATQLGALLATIDEPAPYVVVGHSFGGAEAVAFASRFPEQVAGLVLIDTSPADWPTNLCAIADGSSEFAGIVASTCAGWTDPSANAEHLDVFASFEEVAGVTSLGSLPMTVITAVERQFPGSTPDELGHLTEVWNEGQRRWSELSTVSQVVPVDDTSHDIHVDQPAVVIDAVLELLP